MYYAGIGSRKTPAALSWSITHAAKVLRGLGFVLRSGGADGADTYFERGAGLAKEIYLPWRGFNGNPSPLHTVCDAALEMAAKYHPAWERLNQGAQKLMARNCYQVLGRTLDNPVDFVVTWTSRGQIVGGTGQALRIAADLEIPVFNFATDPNLDKLAAHLRARGLLDPSESTAPAC